MSNILTDPSLKPMFVIFESADIHSSIETIVNCYVKSASTSVIVFVQQSVYNKFCQRFKYQLPNLTIAGKREIQVNYDAIDIECAHALNGVSIYQFRHSDEARVMANHFMQMRFVSLWAEKVALALEFAKLITSSDDIYINCDPNDPNNSSIKEESIDAAVKESTLYVDIRSLMSKDLYASMQRSQTKWSGLPESERNVILNNFIIKNNLTLNTFTLPNNRFREIYDKNGIKMVLSYYKEYGTFAFNNIGKIDARVLKMLLTALQAGNSLVLSVVEESAELKQLYDYLRTVENGDFKDIIYIEKQSFMTEDMPVRYVLLNENKEIGIYSQPSTDKIAFNKLIKNITLQIGDINYAK